MFRVWLKNGAREAQHPLSPRRSLRASTPREAVRTDRLGEDLAGSGCKNPLYVLPSEGARQVPKTRPGAVRISCGRCSRCAITRLNMQIGRACAQSATSAKTLMVTLTYAPDDEGIDPEAAHSLNVEHARTFRKAIKNRYDTRGEKVSYLIAGEYGGKKAALTGTACLCSRPAGVCRHGTPFRTTCASITPARARPGRLRLAVSK